jgi:broad specificity polyphosphatase/5'/3'-nucleotidase SurE
MRILICNDDGMEAPGIAFLAEAALVLGSDVWVVAPERKWTAASHQLSFDRDLILVRKGERSFVCSGAPADCVVAAMTALFSSEPKPDLVLAGVNDKRNVAEDAAYSGTMAIAREATFWGVPAIALSQVNGVSSSAAELATLRRLVAGAVGDPARLGGGGPLVECQFAGDVARTGLAGSHRPGQDCEHMRYTRKDASSRYLSTPAPAAGNAQGRR